MSPVVDPWIICPKPHPDARMRLFCFPYAGGSASAFRLWAPHIPPTIELCAVQLPGRETRLREPRFNRLAPLTRVLADVLASRFDRPFAFFGHSMGALIGFELARELRRQGQHNLKALFVSARSAPQLPGRERPAYMLPEAEFIARLREYDGTPEAILREPDLLQIVIPLLRDDLAINEAYSYAEEPPLDLPIAAFGGLDDLIVDEISIRAWGQQTSSGFTLRMFPGNHWFLNRAPAAIVQTIVQQLQLL
jgi:medium-chain acyl-[acyl-carrier-protein] hydrolase